MGLVEISLITAVPALPGRTGPAFPNPVSVPGEAAPAAGQYGAAPPAARHPSRNRGESEAWSSSVPASPAL